MICMILLDTHSVCKHALYDVTWHRCMRYATDLTIPQVCWDQPGIHMTRSRVSTRWSNDNSVLTTDQWQLKGIRSQGDDFIDFHGRTHIRWKLLWEDQHYHPSNGLTAGCNNSFIQWHLTSGTWLVGWRVLSAENPEPYSSVCWSSAIVPKFSDDSLQCIFTHCEEQACQTCGPLQADLRPARRPL